MSRIIAAFVLPLFLLAGCSSTYSYLPLEEKALYKAYYPYMTRHQRETYLDLPDAGAREDYAKEIGVYSVVHKIGGETDPARVPARRAISETGRRAAPAVAPKPTKEGLEETLRRIQRPPTPLDALRQLDAIHREGLVSEEEYQKKRKEILKRL